MSTPEQSRMRTRMFARVMGPFLTIVPTTVAVRGAYMETLFNEFKANPMWAWLYGAILLMGRTRMQRALPIAAHDKLRAWRKSRAEEVIKTDKSVSGS